MTQLIIGDCIKTGWEVFRKNIGVSIGIVLIYAIIASAGGAIPVINAAVAIVVTPVLTGGLALFSLKVVRGQEGKIEDLFQGFHAMGSFIGAYWLYACIALAAFIPAAIGFGIDVAINGGLSGLVPYCTIVLGAASFIALVIALLRFSMVFYLIVDGMMIIDAFKESARITRGFVGKLFLLGLANGLILLAGMLVIFVGLLAAVPVAMFAYAAAYTRLRGGVPTSVLWPPAGREGNTQGAA